MIDTISSIYYIFRFLWLYCDPIAAALITIIFAIFLVLGLALLSGFCYIIIVAIKKFISAIMNRIGKNEQERNENMADKTIVCKDCQKEFIFSEGEQQFYADRQFSDPVRCKECRDARKANYNK